MTKDMYQIVKDTYQINNDTCQFKNETCQIYIEVNKSDKLKEITPSRQIDNIVGVGGVTIKKRLLRQYKVYLLEGTSRQSSSQQKCL